MDKTTVTNENESNKEVCIIVEESNKEVQINVRSNKEEVHANKERVLERTGLVLQNFVSSVKEDLDALPDDFQLGFIYKVSQKYRRSKEEFYTPRVVAIGPLHHGKSHLQAMETYKLRWLKKLQKKYGNSLLNKLSEYAIIKEHLVRSCYEDFKFEASEFSKMILLDGIFIIQLFLKKDVHDVFKDEQLIDDMLNWNSWMASDVMHDMLLLENQLPLFFIVGLLNILYPYIKIKEPFEVSADYFHETSEESLDSCEETFEHSLPETFQNSSECFEETFQYWTDCLEEFPENPTQNFKEYFLEHSLKYFKEVGITDRLELSPDCKKAVHLVDFLVNLHAPSKREPEPKSEPEPESSKSEPQPVSSESVPQSPCNGRFEYTRSASELLEAGVRFSPLKGELFAVSFEESAGNLRIPQLTVNDKTETFFRNLIAFEQCAYIEKHITSYIIFMDSLINTADDVKLLVKHEIIKNSLVEDQLVADMFNNLYKEVIEDEREFYFADTCNKLNAYRKDYFHRWKSRWFKWKLILKNKYFNNPWSVISFIAAGTVVILTIVQTVCSVLGL